MFMEEQGFKLRSNKVFQYNQSTIRMGTNGRTSCTVNSRHINVRYFFVVDRVKKKEVEIKYCPTEMMIADYFTKPLQGKLFHTLRRLIMGHDAVFDLMEQYFPLKERIGNNENMNENEISKEREEVSESDLSMRKREATDANGTEASCADEGNMKGTDCERERTVVKKKTSWADIVKKRGEIKSDEQNIKGS